MKKLDKIKEIEEAIELAEGGNIKIEKYLFESEEDWGRIREKVVRSLKAEKKYYEGKLKDELYKKVRGNHEPI